MDDRGKPVKGAVRRVVLSLKFGALDVGLWPSQHWLHGPAPSRDKPDRSANVGRFGLCRSGLNLITKDPCPEAAERLADAIGAAKGRPRTELVAR